MQQRRPFARIPYWLPGAALVVAGLVFTAFLYLEQERRLNAIGQARFERQAAEVSLALEKRLAAFTEVVYGMRSWFVADPALTREQFGRAARELDAHARYPGLVNASFTRRVTLQDRDAFESRMRNDASLQLSVRNGFAVHPAAQREEYFVADYVWPFVGNEGIVGFDIGSQPANLQAMQHARATGQMVVSKPFPLMQDGGSEVGTVLRAPVYNSARVGTQVPPAENFLGAVAVTINLVKLMQAVQAESNSAALSVSVADLGNSGSEVRNGSADVFFEQSAGPPLAGLHAATRDVRVHDRYWRLVFQPTESYLSSPERRLPANTAAVAALLVLLLGTVLSLLLRQRGVALLRARSSDAARERSEGRFRALLNQAAVGVALVDIETGRISELNRRFCVIAGRSEAQLQATALDALFEQPPDATGHDASLRSLRSAHGGEFTQEMELATVPADVPGDAAAPQRWVARTVSAMHEGAAREPTHAIVVLHDITERRVMEESFRRNESRLRALLLRLPVGVILMDNNGATALCNERFTELTGYTEVDIPDAECWWEKAYPDPVYREKLQLLWREARQVAMVGGGTMQAAEYRVTCADGQVRPIEIAGVVVGSQLLVTFVDLSLRKAAEEEIRTLAYYDLLTELPNRRLLLNRLREALEHCHAPSHCALMLLDVDNFKALNDTRGHERGDALLKLVANRLRDCVRSDDIVARQGGDEFAVLLEDVGASMESAKAHCEQIAEKILRTLREPYSIGEEAHHSTMSIGVVMFTAADHSVDELLQHVDLAMYQAKAWGRDTLCFYDPSMHAQASERAALEEDMRTGLVLGQFEVYFQPQVDHGRIVAAEALLRWHHPQRGLVSPAVFIPLAEESGLILPLGQWVLDQACTALARWAQDSALAPLSLAVNVSPRQFRQVDFVQQVLATLATTGATARRLTLEITEGLLLHDVDDSAARMSELKSYGVGFSLDDFGTGYSSLSYLKRLPLDQLKIDQSFVRDVLDDPNDASIVRTIVALGSSLGLQVIAEGVETAAQEAFLARHHCHAWQGYLLSRPVPAGEFEALVRQRSNA